MTTKSNHDNPSGACGECDGLGEVCTCYDLDQWSTCRSCHGSGRGQLISASRCPREGHTWARCKTCKGRGQVYVGGVGCDAEDDPKCPDCSEEGK